MLLERTVSVTKLSVLRRKMSNQNLLEIFLKSIDAVQPNNLLINQLKVDERHLLIRGDSYNLHHGCYLVGFGKAVKDMALNMSRLLGSHLQRAVVTVPEGIFRDEHPNINIEFIEGARNNLPDENALKGATKIRKLVEGLGKEDLLFVLISGGGSALLPFPVPPITLEEKQALIQKLAKRGATINELNSVRKQISVLKGGGLAEIAYPSRVVALILSDVIGDPLDIIASGPTIPNTDRPEVAIDILKKYELLDSVPCSVKQVLSKGKGYKKGVPVIDGKYVHVENYVIGNNVMAAEAACSAAKLKGYEATIVSTSVDGDVNEIAEMYSKLAANISKPVNTHNSLEGYLRELQKKLNVTKGFEEKMMNIASGTKMCLIFAGEPTVKVTGSGKGGRNQQLALAFAILLSENHIQNSRVSFLSCGTDGMDGPTDAAGAIAPNNLDGSWKEYGKRCLENNDSYAFFEKWNNGKNLVKIGHTGTNVMDVHVLIIERDE